jgi:hypothetical protein
MALNGEQVRTEKKAVVVRIFKGADRNPSAVTEKTHEIP